MALTTAQYRTMRDLFRGALSVELANPTDANVLSFFKQLLTDAAGAVALSSSRQFLASEIARRFLSGNFSNPTDANVVDFWTALTTDSSTATAMGTTAQYQTMRKALLGAFSCDFFNPTATDILSYFSTYFVGSFALLFPTAFQVVQTDLGLLYGSAPLATAGNTSTTVLALTGALAGTPVPIWAKSTNSASIGAGATFNIYYDGTGTTPAMTGVTPTAGSPVALTGAGVGMSITWAAGTSVNNDTWKATCATLTDQSGNFKDYYQLLPGKQPVVTTGLNGKPGLLFDGVDDLLESTCALPAPGTTPYVGFIVVRRPTTAAGAARMVADGAAEVTAILLDGATQMHLYNNGGFGPITSGLPTNTFGAVEFLLSNSASDYLQIGSVARVTGAGAGNGVAPSRSISSSTVPANIEVLAVGYVPNSGFSSTAYRSAVTTIYGAAVNV